jgi:GPH family glycoside/pentoside/hexuronide:cation symporter
LKIGWGFGSIGTLTVLNAYSLLLLFFLTAILGLSPALAGTLLFGAKIVDAVLAPICGTMSDRTKSKMGRRRPYLLAGAIVCALALIVLFNPPELEQEGLLYFTALGLFLLALGYTLFNVPYIAMPAEMTDSPHERTSIMTWRVTFVAVGQLVVVLATLLIQPFGGGREGYGRVGILLAIIVFLTMLVTFFVTRSARATQPTGITMGAGERWSAALSNRPFVTLILAKILQLIGLSSLTASMLFFVTGVIGASEGTVAVYGLTATVATILTMPLWSKISRVLGKRTTYIIGCAGFSLVTLSWLLAVRGEPIGLIVVRGALTGVFTGGILLMGQSILPDTIDYDARRTGLRREGVYAGAYSFVEKTSMAVGPLLIGWILQLFHFTPSAGPEVLQSTEALRGIYIGMAVLPAGLYFASVVPLFFYNLTDEKLRSTVPPVTELPAETADLSLQPAPGRT